MVALILNNIYKHIIWHSIVYQFLWMSIMTLSYLVLVWLYVYFFLLKKSLVETLNGKSHGGKDPVDPFIIVTLWLQPCLAHSRHLINACQLNELHTACPMKKTSESNGLLVRNRVRGVRFAACEFWLHEFLLVSLLYICFLSCKLVEESAAHSLRGDESTGTHSTQCTPTAFLVNISLLFFTCLAHHLLSVPSA